MEYVHAFLFLETMLTVLIGDATMATEPPYAALPAPHTALTTRGHIPSLDGQDASVSDFSFTTPSAWPAEIVDSMAWSVQFFGAVQSGE
jgi:hypothetical protein